MNPCNVVIRKILLSHRRLFLDGGLLGRRSALYANSGRAVGAPVLASGHHTVPCFTSHLIRCCRPIDPSRMSAPIPIVRKGITLAPFSLASFSCSADRPFTPSPLPSPMPSPPSSPPAPNSPSGLLQAAKDTLHRAVSKRGSKNSVLTIDEDMREMCYFYSQLGSDERSDFLIYMATSLSIDHNNVQELIQQRPQEGTSDADLDAHLMRWEDRLRQALQPPHHWVASQVSRLSGGVKFLVDMRQDLLTTLYTSSSDPTHSAALKTLDSTLRELLSLWFTVGLLNVQRITWESSCNMLQKVSEYEAVHPVRNWTDLKRRVGPYRRCFIFTHSCMPNEPLVVLHIFLTNEISNSMAKILKTSRAPSYDESSLSKDTEDASTISTAIFYSITSTQKGLQGIELGNYLIKRVVRELKAEFPHMTQFSSLSPIPGFVKWLTGMMARAQRDELSIFTATEVNALQLHLDVSSSSQVYDRLRKLFTTNGWVEEPDLVNCLETPLMRLCAYYLYNEKRRGYALDSVANFHLKNGAVMWRINWLADRSPRGLANSCGIMVNYRYFLEDCENNSRTYLETLKIHTTDDVMFLSKTAADLMKPSPVSPAKSPPIIPCSPPPVITITPESKI
ncbi:malonyl-CoA decarboxylase, mitochondrial-like [Penaeus monodon]|uniref:malonyl-CoA decarboxylase, mitochondrial-like n=1 Tax=Penaeus monodon TaxID=6687 RepID=UPI0018A6E721|nr:malonyl-CoA decarboxylase, mitochondrial-like [Penaeus monodon]